MKLLLVGLMFFNALFAQATIQGPLTGWIWDGDGTRPLLGIPGASVIGEKRTGAIPLSRVAVSPTGDYLLGIGVEDQRVYLMEMRTSVMRAVEGIAAGAEVIALSPGGRAAAVLHAGAGRLEVVTGLPGSARIAGVIDLSAEGMPYLVAVSDDAGVLLAAFPGAEDLVAIDTGGNRWRLPHSGRLRGISFFNHRRDALLADDRGVWWLRDFAGNARAELMLEAEALQVLPAADAGHALVTTGEAVLLLNLETGATRRIECACKPGTLARLSGSVFRIREAHGGEPLWIVDVSADQTRATFVPWEVKAGTDQ